MWAKYFKDFFKRIGWSPGEFTHPVYATLDLPSLPQAAKRAEEKRRKKRKNNSLSQPSFRRRRREGERA